MEKRVLLAVTLSFLVLFLYQQYLAPPVPETPQNSSSTAKPAGSNPSSNSAAPAVSPAQAPPAPAAPAEAPLVGESAARDVVVETDAVRAVFSNAGAELKSWTLKKYRNEAGKLVDLIPADLANHPRPFSLTFGNPDAEKRLKSALFKASSETAGTAQRLVFEYQDTEFNARKEFEIGADGHPYVIGLRLQLSYKGAAVNPTVQWGPGLGDALGQSISSYVQQAQGILSAAGETERLAPGDLTEQPKREGTYDFVGIDDQYFIAVALPRRQRTQVTYEVVPVPAPGEEQPRTQVAYSVHYPTPPEQSRYFAGPKDFDVLKAVDGELVRGIHFGMFAFLVVPLLVWLKWVNGFVGNYGWSIITLTIIINAIMAPLRHKSVVSMRKMQELQPEVKAIQDRYAKLKTTDPARQKMNTELMNLYRERKVNPASGCIPIVLTMPVLFAFYTLLSTAIEIRGAPFVGWIHDLSKHDPLYVTPLLMGGTMLWQQLITPAAGDPMQQKMMMFMPVMFTFMFLWAPSGLVLYWLVSNLCTIGQQHITNRIIGPPVVRTPRPAAERRVKKSAGLKSGTADDLKDE